MIKTAWIGYSDEKNDGSWGWEHGDKSTFTNWKVGQPDDVGAGKNCASISRDDGQWSNQDCDDVRKSFLCGFGKSSFSFETAAAYFKVQATFINSSAF